MTLRTTPAAILAVTLVLSGCSEKPAPAPSGGAEAGAAAAEHATPTPEEAVEAATSAAGDSAAAAGSALTVGGLAFSVPEGWENRAPANAMRAAELHAQTPAGPCVAVFSMAGGDVEANIARWVGQFSRADGEIVTGRETRTIAGRTVWLVEMAGDYRGMGGPVSADTMMRAAIVDRPGDQQLFIKMTGPRPGMETLGEGWLALVESVRVP